MDGIYPKGFPIGTVDRVEKNGTAYKQIVLKSAADFSSLEQVLVVLTPPPGRDAEESRRTGEAPRTPEEPAPPKPAAKAEPAPPKPEAKAGPKP
jgi:cell shape-determining protein MreC